MVNRQFYTLKFHSSDLKFYNYNIPNLTFNEAKNKNKIIALADNQILRTIRDIKNQDVDMNIVEDLYRTRDKIKKEKNSSKNLRQIIKIQ